MTKNNIIEDLFKSKNFNECLSKMEPEHLREDLRQEVILVICELPEGKIIGLHERNELEFYTVRVILNMLRNSKNAFAKRFRQNHAELTSNEIADIIEEERELRELVEDLAIEEVEEMRSSKDNKKWYAGELIALYMELGNFRAIQKETGIPLVSCYVTIKRAFESIKKKTKPVLLDQKSLNRMSLTNTKSYLLNPESKVNK